MTSEREKGRRLLDLLTRGRTGLSGQLTGPEKGEETHLRARLTTLESERQQVALSEKPDLVRLAALDLQLKGARDAMDRFHERMSVAHPDMERHRGGAQLISLAQTVDLMPDANTALLEYEVTPAAVFLFVITRQQALHVHTLSISSNALKGRLNRFARELATRDPGFADDAAALYRQLLSPARAELAGKRNLIIVPSGDLWRLSFSSLRNPAGKYLIETAAISYAPSLSVLRAYASQKPRAAEGRSLLAFGDPGGNLPEAAREAQTIASLYGAANSRTFLGAAADKENFRAYAPRYDVIHVATHGVFDDHDPMYSHLLLAGSGTTAHRSVPLDAAEIAEMQLSSTLVVLSSCETAEGRYLEGEGLVGLGWSFLAAGSQSAIASQWRVDSASTTELMIAFHRNLQQHMKRAEALRRAALLLARDPRYSHPFYWAGFVLMGES